MFISYWAANLKPLMYDHGKHNRKGVFYGKEMDWLAGFFGG